MTTINKKDVRDRFWVAIGGSIYCEDLEDMKSAFTGKTIKMRKSIAFNVGAVVAPYIVETHNAHLKWKRENSIQVIVPKYNPETGFDMLAFFDELNGKK